MADDTTEARPVYHHELQALLAQVRPHGCICPPGSEATCQGQSDDFPDLPKPDRLMSSVMSMAQDAVDRVERMRAALVWIESGCSDAPAVARAVLRETASE